MANSFKNVHTKITKMLSKSKYASLLLEDIHSLSGILLTILPLFAVSTASDMFKFVPILGLILKGAISYEATKSSLMSILNEFSRISLEVNSFLRDQNSLENKLSNLISVNNDKNKTEKSIVVSKQNS